MDRDQFENILDAQIKRVRDVLVLKATEYANEDRLANFKKAAVLAGRGIPQIIGGMMIKHTVSIYDMIESGKPYSIDVWNEKITDHINYLILLRASLIENANSDQGTLSC
jgi:hypothetical protein